MAELEIRLYDLRGPEPSSRSIIEHALWGCFARDSRRLAVVLQNGDVVIADLNGKIVRRLQSGRKMLGEDVEYEQGVSFLGIRRADIDW